MKNKKGYTLFELLIVLCGVVVIGLIGGGIYVAIHFISKFWQNVT